MILVARPLSVFLSLAPFRNIHFRDKVFVSWVGLRGAVPISFAILPLASGIEGARIIFNIVFVITIVSLLFKELRFPLLLNVWAFPKNRNILEKLKNLMSNFLRISNRL